MPKAAHLRTAQPAAARRETAAEAQKRLFLRKVSHELRTPLNSILGFSEILNSELYGPLGAPQYKEYAGIIRDSGQKLLNLVNQVLEVARLEAGAVDFCARAEPLEAALDDVLDDLEPVLTANEVTVEVAGRGALPDVLADPRGLRTTLFHLLHNAATFSPPGGVVRVAAQALGGHVEIVIRDEGPGVDPKALRGLVAPLMRGEAAVAARPEGLGLGLTLSDLACRAMGGRLSLASRPGKGLTAGVRLPAA